MKSYKTELIIFVNFSQEAVKKFRIYFLVISYCLNLCFEIFFSDTKCNELLSDICWYNVKKISWLRKKIKNLNFFLNP